MFDLFDFSKIGMNNILKKIVKNIIHNFLFVLSLMCFIASVCSLFVITKHSYLQKDYSWVGFNDFQTIFSFPIKLLIGFTTLLGIHVAYKKYNQDSVHFKKQFKQQNRNIKINNYYHHTDEFIMSVEFLIDDIIENESLKPLFPKCLREEFLLKDYDNFVRQKITKYFTSNIHRIWFGPVSDSNLHIKGDIFFKVQQLYDMYLESIENNNIKLIIKDLGLNRILVNTNSETSNIYFYLIFRLCKHVLDFDNKHFENELKLYHFVGI